jgi:hypothetical protein
VWARGIALCCGAYPITFPKDYPTSNHFLTRLFTFGYLFRYLSYGNINKKLARKNSVYIKTDELNYFRRRVLPKIKVPFVLVTGDSDCSTSEFKDILKNKYLLHWFAQNNDIEDGRVATIPIGLNYASLIFGDAFGETRKSLEDQEAALIDIKDLGSKPKMQVLANFHLNCTSGRRKKLYDLLKNNPCMYFQPGRMPRTEMWKLQKKFAFNFSPIGNGLDCHRTWESLILGQIPIVERTGTPLDDLHEQFPVVVIDDVSEINEKNLKKWYNKYFKQLDEDLEKRLTNDYWVGLIEKKMG